MKYNRVYVNDAKYNVTALGPPVLCTRLTILSIIEFINLSENKNCKNQLISKRFERLSKVPTIIALELSN